MHQQLQQQQQPQLPHAAAKLPPMFQFRASSSPSSNSSKQQQQPFYAVMPGQSQQQQQRVLKQQQQQQHHLQQQQQHHHQFKQQQQQQQQPLVKSSGPSTARFYNTTFHPHSNQQQQQQHQRPLPIITIQQQPPPVHHLQQQQHSFQPHLKHHAHQKQQQQQQQQQPFKSSLPSPPLSATVVPSSPAIHQLVPMALPSSRVGGGVEVGKGKGGEKKAEMSVLNAARILWRVRFDDHHHPTGEGGHEGREGGVAEDGMEVEEEEEPGQGQGQCLEPEQGRHHTTSTRSLNETNNNSNNKNNNKRNKMNKKTNASSFHSDLTDDEHVPFTSTHHISLSTSVQSSSSSTTATTTTTTTTTVATANTVKKFGLVTPVQTPGGSPVRPSASSSDAAQKFSSGLDRRDSAIDLGFSSSSFSSTSTVERTKQDARRLLGMIVEREEEVVWGGGRGGNNGDVGVLGEESGEGRKRKWDGREDEDVVRVGEDGVVDGDGESEKKKRKKKKKKSKSKSKSDKRGHDDDCEVGMVPVGMDVDVCEDAATIGTSPTVRTDRSLPPKKQHKQQPKPSSTSSSKKDATALSSATFSTTSSSNEDEEEEARALAHIKSTTALAIQRRAVKLPVLPACVDMKAWFGDTRGAPSITWPKGGPMTFEDGTKGLDLLTKEEAVLCRTLRLWPEQYLKIKETVCGATFVRGCFKKKDVRRWFPIDVNKVNKLYDWFLELGWIPGEGDDEWERRREWVRTVEGSGKGDVAKVEGAGGENGEGECVSESVGASVSEEKKGEEEKGGQEKGEVVEGGSAAVAMDVCA
ncbi:Transcriptional adapter ada2 [Phlyctochytrium planicorne]|nr:Transcriptional adapter ada2 [Phlyctochytrium planicorne]